jgi:hypothetical protein
MEPAIQQEILLMTNTTFFQKQCIEKNSLKSVDFSSIDQLEDICWGMLLNKMFPEIMSKTMKGKALNLWQIWNSENSLQIQLCETPLQKINQFSIDGYNFLPMMYYS